VLPTSCPALPNASHLLACFSCYSLAALATHPMPLAFACCSHYSVTALTLCLLHLLLTHYSLCMLTAVAALLHVLAAATASLHALTVIATHCLCLLLSLLAPHARGCGCFAPTHWCCCLLPGLPVLTVFTACHLCLLLLLLHSSSLLTAWACCCRCLLLSSLAAVVTHSTYSVLSLLLLLAPCACCCPLSLLAPCTHCCRVAKVWFSVMALRGHMHRVCALTNLPNTWVTGLSSTIAKCK
jgi:hypothetical protein